MSRSLKNVTLATALVMLTMWLISCGSDDPEPIEPPFASFTVTVDDVNTLSVSFANTSIDGASFSWDFGDGTGTSDQENPTYTYTAGGTYTVTLTVTNEGGSDDASEEVNVSGFGPNLIVNGDFEAEDGWTELALWTAEDNAVLHGIVDGQYMFQNASDPVSGDKYQWSNFALFQAVTLTAGSTYKLDADISSSSGTTATWFEVFLVKEAPIDESNIGGDAVQFFLKSFGDGEDCSGTPFDGGIIEVATQCTLNTFPLLIDDEGFFTVTADDLNGSGQVYLVFKTGSGFAAEGDVAGYNDGVFMDNVELKEVL